MSYFTEKHGSLLNEEMSLQINPALAIAIGLNNAIVLQQIRFCLAQPKSGRVIDGEKYVWNTYEEWVEQHFPWWSAKTLQRVFMDLEKMGLIKSIQPDGVMSRRKYYTMHEGAVRRLTYERMDELKYMSDRTGQVGVFDRTTCPHAQDKLGSSSTEITSETSTETTQPSILPWPTAIGGAEQSSDHPRLSLSKRSDGSNAYVPPPAATKGPLQLRAEKIFRRRLDTVPSIREKQAFKNNADAIKATPEEDWKCLEAFYSAPQQQTYARKDLPTLLNNWSGEIDRARAWCQTHRRDLLMPMPCAKEAPPEPVGWQDFANSNFPDCEYAVGGPRYGTMWASVDKLAQKSFTEAMARADCLQFVVA